VRSVGRRVRPRASRRCIRQAIGWPVAPSTTMSSNCPPARPAEGPGDRRLISRGNRYVKRPQCMAWGGVYPANSEQTGRIAGGTARPAESGETAVAGSFKRSILCRTWKIGFRRWGRARACVRFGYRQKDRSRPIMGGRHPPSKLGEVQRSVGRRVRPRASRRCIRQAIGWPVAPSTTISSNCPPARPAEGPGDSRLISRGNRYLERLRCMAWGGVCPTNSEQTGRILGGTARPAESGETAIAGLLKHSILYRIATGPEPKATPRMPKRPYTSRGLDGPSSEMRVAAPCNPSLP